MFENLDELMDRDVTQTEHDEGIYFSTAISGYYLEITSENGEMLVIVYETASFPSDGYMPSVKRVADVVYPQVFADLKLKDIAMDMIAAGRAKYIPVHELEDWEAKALKDAVIV